MNIIGKVNPEYRSRVGVGSGKDAAGFKGSFCAVDNILYSEKKYIQNESLLHSYLTPSELRATSLPTGKTRNGTLDLLRIA